jgi:hypothetical protein
MAASSNQTIPQTNNGIRIIGTTARPKQAARRLRPRAVYLLHCGALN